MAGAEFRHRLKSRKLAHELKQVALRQADAALAALRVETKELERRIAMKTMPVPAKDDLTGALADQELRAWLRGLPAPERQREISRAIGREDAAMMSAALARPEMVAVEPILAAMLMDSWRKLRCPEELARLERLEKTSAAVQAAGERLQRRFDEGYDHLQLDALEKPASERGAA